VTRLEQRRLEGMNSVHPRHSAASFAGLHHYIITFHDSTFECVAERYTISTARGSITAALPLITGSLNRSA